jgi:hypothetical protein
MTKTNCGRSTSAADHAEKSGASSASVRGWNDSSRGTRDEGQLLAAVAAAAGGCAYVGMRRVGQRGVRIGVLANDMQQGST